AATPAAGRQPVRAAVPRDGKPTAPIGDVPRPVAKAAVPAAPAIPAVPRPPSPVERRPANPPRTHAEDAPSVPKTKTAPTAAPVPPPRGLSRRELGIDGDGQPARSWEERLGPVGIAVFAIVACAVAWFVTYRFF